MEKRAIVTFCYGEGFKEVSAITYPRIKAYAKKCNADFIEIEPNQIAFPNMMWNKHYIYGLFENKKYDRILWLDADILISKHAPNIFDTFRDDFIGMLNEAKYFPERIKQKFWYFGALDSSVNLWSIDDFYFNAGVMLVPRKYASLFCMPLKFIDSPMHEQDHFNFLINVCGMTVNDIEYKWNHLNGIKEPDRQDSYFIHFSNLSPTKDMELIKKYDAMV